MLFRSPQVVALSYAVSFALGAVGVGMMFAQTDIALGLAAGAVLLGIAAALWLKRIDMSKPAESAGRPESPPATAPKMP